jgi:hypothetical protein
MKIETIPLHSLHNDEHFQFMSEVDSLIEDNKADDLGISLVYPDFKQSLKNEDAALKVEDSSPLTPAVNQMDRLRDDTWSAIDKRIDSTLLSPIEDEVPSAVVLRRIVDQYGDPRYLAHDVESGVLTNLVADLMEPANAGHLAKVGITAWVPELKKQNDKLISLVKERNKEIAQRGSGNVKGTRILLDPKYMEIVEIVNSTFTLKLAKPAAITFTNELNQRIKKYKANITARGTRNAKSKGTDTK